jgi:signal transduction histidine kinase
VHAETGRAKITLRADAVLRALRYVRVVRRLGTPPRFDLGLAAVLLALALVETFWTGVPGFSGGGPSEPALVATSLAASIALAWRRLHPATVLAAVLAAFAVQTAALGATWDALSPIVWLFIAVYSVAAYSPVRVAVGGLLATLAVVSIADSEDVADISFIALIFGAVWVAGLGVRRQRDLVGRLADHAALLEREQEARALAAAAEERAMIARELHDVVAHSVSTMVVQAEAGEALLDRDPERAREAFDSIRGSGRQALVELRRMLGLLRSGDPELALVPQPSLQHLDLLVEQVRSAGLPVDVEVEGRPRPLAAGVDLSAYRIVQEALTNTLKHSASEHARVTVRYADHDVEVEVVDDGRGSLNGAGTGHGLAGMRERALLYGGEIEAGPRAEGGFRVRARLPLA